MKDRNNFDFEELIDLQEQHLKTWGKLLRTEIHAQVCMYVRRHNQQAPTTNDKHTVWRGQDLIEIIRSWPEPEKSVYPPVKEPVEEEKKEGQDFI